MVCKHKSEWSYTPDEIEEELKEYQKLELEKAEGEIKKKLAEVQKREIKLIRERVENLCFWEKIEHGESEYLHQGIYNWFKEPWFGEEIKKKTERFFNTNQKEVWHFHPIAFVEHMKMITEPKYQSDHGDFHDPIVNPQVRGWYGSRHLNKDTDIAKWNPYASMKIHKHASEITNEKVKDYGKPQRSSGSHQGLDIYAPVGTPIYACVDGKITMHRMTKKSAGFKIKLEGKYKDKHIRFNYIHLMQFEKTKFRFYNQNSSGKLGDDYGWLNYSDFTTPKEFTDPKKKETYSIHYSNGILKIDQNEIDVELALKITRDLDVTKGQIIGYTGSTGNSYQGKKANHLHFNTYINWKSVLPYEQFKDYFGLDASGTETSTKQDGVTPSSNW